MDMSDLRFKSVSVRTGWVGVGDRGVAYSGRVQATKCKTVCFKGHICKDPDPPDPTTDDPEYVSPVCKGSCDIVVLTPQGQTLQVWKTPSNEYVIGMCLCARKLLVRLDDKMLALKGV